MATTTQETVKPKMLPCSPKTHRLVKQSAKEKGMKITRRTDDLLLMALAAERITTSQSTN